MIRLPSALLIFWAGCTPAVRGVQLCHPEAARSPGSDASVPVRSQNNGYTSAPALPPEKLTPESLERFGDPETWARDRHDTLQPTAYGYLRLEDGWMVMFCFKHIPDDEAGRAVEMAKDGSGIQMKHKDARLAVAE
jgi:hypothetical protein